MIINESYDASFEKLLGARNVALMFDNKDKYTDQVIRSFTSTKNDADRISNMLSKKDMEDPIKVCDKIKSYYNRHRLSCADYAGRVAGMMNYYGLPYEVRIGLVIPDRSQSGFRNDFDRFIKMVDYIKENNYNKNCNHVWLVHNGKVYETDFTGDDDRSFYTKLTI